ncbi:MULTISPECIES: hypothetical protein [Aphanothece]
MTPSPHLRAHTRPLARRRPLGQSVMVLLAALGLLGLQAGSALAHPDHHQPTQQGQNSSHQGQNSAEHGHDHQH